MAKEPPRRVRAVPLFSPYASAEVGSALTGRVAALASPIYFADEIKDGRLIRPFEATLEIAQGYWLAYRNDRRRMPKIVALRAWYPATVVADRYGYLPHASADTMEAAEADLRRMVDVARAAHPDVSVEGEMFNSAAERALTDAADNASLVVVGSRGHHAVGEVLMGSVGQALLHHAHCPVAIIH